MGKGKGKGKGREGSNIKMENGFFFGDGLVMGWGGLFCELEKVN